MAENIFAAKTSLLQMLILNSTCLGEKGLNSILNTISRRIREDQKMQGRLNSEKESITKETRSLI